MPAELIPGLIDDLTLRMAIADNYVFGRDAVFNQTRVLWVCVKHMDSSSAKDYRYLKPRREFEDCMMCRRALRLVLGEHNRVKYSQLMNNFTPSVHCLIDPIFPKPPRS